MFLLKNKKNKKGLQLWGKLIDLSLKVTFSGVKGVTLEI